MNTSKLLGIGLAALLILVSATAGFSQVSQNRIPQQIVINGQHVNGAYVMAPGGGMQSFTCSNPQQYVTPDEASQGWACYDQAAGVWLLNSVPPAAAQAQPPAQVQPQQPGVIYQQPPAVIYQQQPTVIYQQPPTVIYQQPAFVYAAPRYVVPRYSVGYRYPVVVRPVYQPRVVLGAAAIHATGRIVSAALLRPHYYSGHNYSPSRSHYVNSGGHYRR